MPFDRLGEIAETTGVEKRWLLHGDEELSESQPDLRRRLEALEGKVDRLDEQTARGFESLESAIEQLAERLPPPRQAEGETR